jgi:hypothetical protein
VEAGREKGGWSLRRQGTRSPAIGEALGIRLDRQLRGEQARSDEFERGLSRAEWGAGDGRRGEDRRGRRRNGGAGSEPGTGRARQLRFAVADGRPPRASSRR